MPTLNLTLEAEGVIIKPHSGNYFEITLEVEANDFFGAVETEEIAEWAKSEKTLDSLISSLRKESGDKAILGEFSDQELLEYFTNEYTLETSDLQKFYAEQMEEWAHENGWIKKGEEYE